MPTCSFYCHFSFDTQHNQKMIEILAKFIVYFLGNGGGQYRIVWGTTLAVGSWSEDCCEGVGYMLVVNILNESPNPRGFPLLLWYLFLPQKSNSNFRLWRGGGGEEKGAAKPSCLLASGNLHGQGCMAGDPLERVLQSACLHKPASSQNKKSKKTICPLPLFNSLPEN